eukprot:1406137-Rhodomonas_salina.3
MTALSSRSAASMDSGAAETARPGAARLHTAPELRLQGLGPLDSTRPPRKTAWQWRGGVWESRRLCGVRVSTATLLLPSKAALSLNSLNSLRKGPVPRTRKDDHRIRAMRRLQAQAWRLCHVTLWRTWPCT